MRKIPVNIQKVFNFAKSNERMSIYRIAKALELDYKNVHAAVKRGEELGLLASVMDQSKNRSVRLVFVRPEMANLKIDTVFLESGSRLLVLKELRRKAYFEMYGSMSLPKKTEFEGSPPKPSDELLGTVDSLSLSPRAAKPYPWITLRKKPFII